jgi:hypothetical protein
MSSSRGGTPRLCWFLRLACETTEIGICGRFVEFWRSLGVAAIRPDFVGSKCEMSQIEAYMA